MTIDGIVGRVVELPLIKKRRRERQDLYLQIPWPEVVRTTQLLRTDHATRLWMLVRLQAFLDRPEDGWIKPRKNLLEALGLPSPLRDVIDRLERAEVVEVHRRPGKRSLLRLLRPTTAETDRP